MPRSAFIIPLHLHLPRRAAMTCSARSRTAPILVADVLDTLVADPFFNGMSSYFGFNTFEDFVGAKTPDLWVRFENGQVDENEVARNFFKNGRRVDLHDFKRYLSQSYCLLPGVAEMLTALRNAEVDVHLCSNYPIWADLIEDALQLSPRFGVNWTFVSGREGVRKPDKEAFLRVARKANVEPSSCVMLDDRRRNCDGAVEAGYLAAIHFQNAAQASREIRELYLRKNITINFEAD